MDKYELNPFGLSIEDVYKLSQKPHDIRLSSELKKRIRRSRKFLEKFFEGEDVSYNDIFIQNETFLSLDETRAIMILQAYTLSLGYSGVRIEVIEKILEFLRKDLIPLIPEGKFLNKNFNPMIFIIYALNGKGEVIYKNKKVKTEKVLKELNIEPINLDSKEISALTSESPYICGILSLCFVKIQKLRKISEIATALYLESLKTESKFLNPIIQALKPHLGLIRFYENLRKILLGSEIISSPNKPKDIYLLGYISRVFFFFHQSIDFIKDILEIEINSISYSPIIDYKQEFILDKNPYISTLIYVIYYLSMIITNLTCLLENLTFEIQSTFKLNLSSLYNACHRLVEENKKLSKSLGNITSSLHRNTLLKTEIKNIIKLKKIVKNWEKIIAINLLYMVQGIAFCEPLKCGRGTEISYQFIKSLLSSIQDKGLDDRIQILEDKLYDLLNHVEEEIGELF